MIPLQGKSTIISGDEELFVTREGAVDYIDGKPRPSCIEKFRIICNVQPVEGRDLLLVPEGDRHREPLWVWAEQIEKPVELNDIVTRCGDRYQIQSLQNWGSFSEFIMMRIDVGPNAKC